MRESGDIERALARVLADQPTEAEVLSAVRDILIRLEASGKVTEEAVDRLLARVGSSCASSLALSSLHEETSAIVRHARLARERRQH